MRHMIATLVLLAAALPAAGAEPVCTTVTIDHVEGSPQATVNDWAEGAPRYAVVGDFVWFDFGVDPSSGEADTLSFDVSDIDVEAAVACSDGSVTIERAAPVDTEAPVETTTSLTPVCEAHADTLTHYCTLGNQVLVIS